MGVRDDFPIFRRMKESFVYLDNAATTQKPDAVIKRMEKYYSEENCNIHRGNYPLSRQAEALYEHARETVREWLDAADTEEIVFTQGCTGAINLVASSVGETWMEPGDNCIVTELEHSSNYFSWKHQCDRCGAEFRVANARQDGTVDEQEILGKMDRRTRLIAVTAMSNVTGYRPKLEEIIREAHRNGTMVLVDAAQAIAHERISVRKLDCDFLCFSGHKVYGPMGTGVLYGKRRLLEEMKPYLYGGGMVEMPACGTAAYRTDAMKFEAGTQNIAGVLGLEAALEYLNETDFDRLAEEERRMARHLRARLQAIHGIHVLGEEEDAPILSFTGKRLGAYDIGVLLGNRGIAVRCGEHCAYPLAEKIGGRSCRISLGCYNTMEEIDRTADVLESICGK